MNSVRDFKPFPIPVVSADAPSDFAQDDGLDYLAMPKDMETYRPPMLPEPEDIARQAGAQVIHAEINRRRCVKSARPGQRPPKACHWLAFNLRN